jgi:hypothetical protein
MAVVDMDDFLVPLGGNTRLLQVLAKFDPDKISGLGAGECVMLAGTAQDNIVSEHTITTFGTLGTHTSESPSANSAFAVYQYQFALPG